MKSHHHAKNTTDDFLSRCKTGDAEALSRLYHSHHQSLLKVAQHYVSDIDVARDVEHDAWVMILTSINSLQNEKSLEGWMKRIVRNTAINHLKHERVSRQVSIEQADGMRQESSDEFLPPPLPVIMSMVSQLPQGYERVFRLHAFDGLTHQQIGDLLGISASTSRSQLSHARDLLRKMMLRYWALALLALLAPLATLMLLNRDNKSGSINKPDTQRPTSKQPITTAPSSIQPSAPPVLATAPHHPTQFAQTFSSDNEGAIIPSFNTSTQLVAGDNVAATFNIQLLPAPQQTIAPPSIPMRAKSYRQRPQRQSLPWQMHLAYGGNGGMASAVTDNFLTVVNFAGGESERGMRLYTWGDYCRYVDENASLMDSVDASRMTAIAERHVKDNDKIPDSLDGSDIDRYNDATPLSETKRHERPRTIQLSLSVPLSGRWSLNSGLGFTWMKSTFEADNGNGNDITRRTQRLYYLNVPLGATYTIWQRNKLSVYASGSMRLDIPVKGRETTEWVYTGRFEHAPGDSLVFPTTHATVKAPWQWSVGANVGIQYQLLPHVKAYFEPGFRYYFPTGSPVETYRTEHPFDVAFPFGIRITP